MGGGSSSSSSSRQETRNIDRRIGAAQGSVVVSEGAKLTTVDPGAIALGEKALDANVKTTQSALTAIGENADKAFQFVNKQLEDDDTALTRDTFRNLMIGASVVAVSVAYVATNQKG